jgi:hypothetical protein
MVGHGRKWKIFVNAKNFHAELFGHWILTPPPAAAGKK